MIKRFEVIKAIREADRIINLCKLKIHTFSAMTGAVKNNFGVVPGLFKPGYHAKLKDGPRFAGMRLDLADLVAPRLSIMDAVVAMEGEMAPAPETPARSDYSWRCVRKVLPVTVADFGDPMKFCCRYSDYTGPGLGRPFAKAETALCIKRISKVTGTG